MQGRIYSINISKSKGTAKVPVKKAKLVENLGMENDAHAQEGVRQVSLLALESIKKQNQCPKIKKTKPLKPGDFAENITTEGLKLSGLNIGDRLVVGKNIVLEISKIGKECHRYCQVYYKTGDCIMPREGIFAKVIKGGEIKTGDMVTKK